MKVDPFTIGARPTAELMASAPTGGLAASARQTCRPASPEKPMVRAYPDQSKCFAGNRCPALPTARGLANGCASWSLSVRPWCAAVMHPVCPQRLLASLGQTWIVL